LVATGARTFDHFVAPSLQRPTINGLWSTSNNKHNFSHQTWSFANIKTGSLCLSFLVLALNNERNREETLTSETKRRQIFSAARPSPADWLSLPRLFLSMSALSEDESIRYLFSRYNNNKSHFLVYQGVLHLSFYF
jgi:hypothetical protein